MMKYTKCSDLKALFEKTFNRSVKNNRLLSNMLNEFYFLAFKHDYNLGIDYLDIDYLNRFKKYNSDGYKYICSKLNILL